MIIQKRMALTISGAAFAGAMALTLGAAGPAGAQTTTTSHHAIATAPHHALAGHMSGQIRADDDGGYGYGYGYGCSEQSSHQ